MKSVQFNLTPEQRDNLAEAGHIAMDISCSCAVFKYDGKCACNPKKNSINTAEEALNLICKEFIKTHLS